MTTPIINIETVKKGAKIINIHTAKKGDVIAQVIEIVFNEYNLTVDKDIDQTMYIFVNSLFPPSLPYKEISKEAFNKMASDFAKM